MPEQRRVWVWYKQSWRKATAEGAMHGKTRRVRLDSDGSIVKSTRVMPQKHNGRRRTYSCKQEVVPMPRKGPRPPRFNPPRIVVEPVSFRAPGQHGDYHWQLAPQQSATYGDKLHVYNENVPQQRDKTDNNPGGGNAIARMYRSAGTAIGMPTGEYGGFASLDEPLANGAETAKDVIDEAIDEIEDHLLKNSRFTTVYYCTNAKETDERKDLIGMGIFRIDRDVRLYITDKLKMLPSSVRNKYMDQRRRAELV